MLRLNSSLMKAFSSSSSSLEREVRFDFRFDKLAVAEAVRVDRARASRKGWRSVDGASHAASAGTPDAVSDKLKQENVRLALGDREDEKSEFTAWLAGESWTFLRGDRVTWWDWCLVLLPLRKAMSSSRRITFRFFFLSHDTSSLFRLCIPHWRESSLSDFWDSRHSLYSVVTFEAATWKGNHNDKPCVRSVQSEE